MRITIFTTLIALCIIPSVGEAYFTTGQGAQLVDETTSIFSITYQFGHKTKDMFLPVRALRGSTGDDSLGYTLMEEGETPIDFGHIDTAIVSNAAITADGWYKVPAGELREFTLYAALEYERQTEDLDVALQVTSLPFYFGPDMNKNGLNDGELTKYITAKVDLDETRSITGPVMTLKRAE